MAAAAASICLAAAPACGPRTDRDTSALLRKLADDPRVGVDRLTVAERETLIGLIGGIAAPCDGVRTIAEELLDPASDCGRARGAARFIARRLVDGFGRADIEAQVLRRYRDSQPVSIDTTGAPVLGPPDAPVRIVVFSDFECPHCARAAAILHEVRSRRPESIRIAFKHFPLDSHPMAMSAARASVAAHAQDRFREFHDALFEAPESIGPRLYVEIATRLGMDIDRFEIERLSDASANVIRQDKAEGLRIGVESTPAIFVNGRRFEDSIDVLAEWIEED